MGSKTPSVRPIKRSDLDLFGHHGFSVRGFVIELNNEVVAVYGVLHTSPLQAFSEINEKLKAYPKTIMRAILSFKNIMKHYNKPIYAIPSDKQENSIKVLERIGFTLDDEGYYVWKG